MTVTEEKLLTFSLGNEGYGISILKVKEIIGMMPITPVPKTPSFVKGVVNLRGKIIPVMDLRIKFNMEEKSYNERTCIIVVETVINNVQRLLGVVVDTVSEVVNISADEIEPSPQYSTGMDSNFILGIGKLKDRVVIIIDLDQIFINNEIINIFEKQEVAVHE
ncbi:MAG: chemotaxis protein CheW [Candidatus Gastranaerophilales bacterium]|nr:chemotaxis protein CheW [Candidatus Gastranaerophilales bacterium]